MKEIDAMKVAELKAELKALGLSTTGKKAELSDRLREAVSKTNESADVPDTAFEADPATAQTTAHEPAKEADANASGSPDRVAETSQTAPAAAAEPVPGETKDESVLEPAAEDNSTRQPEPQADQPSGDRDAMDVDTDQARAEAANSQQADGKSLAFADNSSDMPKPAAYSEDEDALSLGSQPTDEEPGHMEDVHTSPPASTTAVDAAVPAPASASRGKSDSAAEPDTKRRRVANEGDSKPAGSSAQPAGKAEGDRRQPIQYPDAAITETDPATAAPSASRAQVPISQPASAHVPPPPQPPSQRQPQQLTRAPSATDTPADPPTTGKRKRAQIVFDETPSSAASDRKQSLERRAETVHLTVAEATGVTRALWIEGMKRPLKEPELKALLQEAGTLTAFWLVGVKSHCYAVFESEQQAEATFTATDKKHWPDNFQSIMRPKYVDPSAADAVSKAEGPVHIELVPAGTSPVHMLHGKDAGAVHAGRISDVKTMSGAHLHVPAGGDMQMGPGRRSTDLSRGGMRGERVPVAARLQPMQGSEKAPQGEADMHAGADQGPGSEQTGAGRPEGAAAVKPGGEGDMARPGPSPEPEAVPLTDLFKKTATKPAIYWLPLTDEQVSAKQATPGMHAS